MKFTAIFEEKTGNRKPWAETYEIDNVRNKAEAEEWCRTTIQWFNDTRQKNTVTGKYWEAERVFVKLKGYSEKISYKNHEWHKDCLHTLRERSGRLYDKQLCSRCGITGRRYGLAPDVKIDYRFRHPDYQRCDTAMKKRGIEVE